MKSSHLLQSKQSSNSARLWILLSIVLAVLVLFTPNSSVKANAAPPPTKIWIYFYDENGNAVIPKSFQVIECADENCNQSSLLDKFGICDDELCLDTPVSSELLQPLGCSENTCFMTTSYDHEFASYIKIAGRFNNKFLVSNLLTPGEFMGRGDTLLWRVNILDEHLEIVYDVSFQPPNKGRLESGFIGFAFTFLLTLVIEFLIAGLGFYALNIKNGSWQQAVGIAGITALINLISYPLTWFLLPLFGNFQPLGERSIAPFVVLVSAIFMVLMIAITLVEGKYKLATIMTTAITLPICFLVTGFVYLANSSHNIYYYGVAVAGLPSHLIILLSEIFAVLFESVLMYLFLRKHKLLSLKQATLISLAMNFASYMIGKTVMSQL